MLNWFRNKSKSLVPLMTVALLGGMFSFFCPHCLAKMANTDASQVSIHDPCSHMNTGMPGPVQSHKHCNGSCTCGGNIMLIGNRHPAALSDYKGFPDFRIPVLKNSTLSVSGVNDIHFVIGRPYKPDRAVYPPLERTCVLLN